MELTPPPATKHGKLQSKAAHSISKADYTSRAKRSKNKFIINVSTNICKNICIFMKFCNKYASVLFSVQKQMRDGTGSALGYSFVEYGAIIMKIINEQISRIQT